jgi:hypothetical protein
MDGEPLMDSEGIGEVRQAMVLTGRISTARGIRISMADLFKASTAGDMDRRIDLMADARK